MILQQHRGFDPVRSWIVLETSAGQRVLFTRHPGLAFAGHRRLRFSFFANKLDATGRARPVLPEWMGRERVFPFPGHRLRCGPVSGL